jgi:hypothetical protein
LLELARDIRPKFPQDYRDPRWAVLPPTGYLLVPHEGLLPREGFPASPEAVAHIGHRPLQVRFVVRFVMMYCVMVGQFGKECFE